jgi:alpha-beta hydrolase superfamily lysophospholipase
MMREDEFTRQMPDGVQLYYRSWDPEGSPRGVVCLVHGLGEHVGRYTHAAAHLNSAGYAVLAYDQRGHGRSKGPRGHSPAYDTTLDDVGSLLEEAAARHSGRPVFLYGQSQGGNVVLNYALRRKPALAGVVATSPALRPAMPIPAWKRRVADLLYERRPCLQMPNGLDASALCRDAEVVRRYRDDPLVHDRATVRFGSDILTSGEWALAHAEEFPLPLLLIHGSADRITCPKASCEFATKIDGLCTFILVQGCYHELHNEPESHEVLDTIVAWLDQHAQTESGEYAS